MSLSRQAFKNKDIQMKAVERNLLTTDLISRAFNRSPGKESLELNCVHIILILKLITLSQILDNNFQEERLDFD